MYSGEFSILSKKGVRLVNIFILSCGVFEPELNKVLYDNKFSKAVAAKDFSFLQTHYITIRQLLQCFGTEIMRGYFGDNL